MPIEQKSRDELDKPIWGVEAIAAAANLTVRQAYHALESGYLPGSKAAENGSRLGAGYSPGFPARTEVIMAMQRKPRGGEPRRMWSFRTCDPPTSNRQNQQDAKCNYNMGLAFASMNCDETAVLSSH